MRKLTTGEFIEKARAVHGDKYDYSQVEYVGNKKKVIITCPDHGEFEQSPDKHLMGRGCVECAGLRRSTTSEFIKKAKIAHGDRYDYSKVTYVNNHTKVKIICHEHGVFEQKPNGHLGGKGCLDCSGSKKSTTGEFIQKAKIAHGDRYDYSKVTYVNNRTKVTIECHEHGVFEQLPYDHLIGDGGCRKCCTNRHREMYALNTVEFIQKARTVHGDKYDYSKVEYVKVMQNVTIICPDHGEFEQIPNNHMMGAGCPKCIGRVSKAEQKIIDFISENYDGPIETSVSPDFMQGKLELDIYLPEKRLAFEYNGNYWHDKKPEGYHRNKTKMCAEAGVELYHVWESDYNDNPEEIFELIKLELNKWQ